MNTFTKTQNIRHGIKGIEACSERLAIAVIVQALRDIQGFKLKSEDARSGAWDWCFDDSGSYWFWCEVAGVDGHQLRRRLHKTEPSADAGVFTSAEK